MTDLVPRDVGGFLATDLEPSLHSLKTRARRTTAKEGCSVGWREEPPPRRGTHPAQKVLARVGSTFSGSRTPVKGSV